MSVIGKDCLVSRQLSPLETVQPSKAGAGAAITHQKDVEKAATDFEALLLQQMFQSMWTTVPKGGLLSGSREEELFTEMLNEAVAKSVAENQSIGIKDVLAKDMQKPEKESGSLAS